MPKNPDISRRLEELDEFWDLDAMLPPRKAPLPFARDTSTVPVTISEAHEDDGSIPIPPPDPERLARARAALRAAEQKHRPALSDFPDENEKAYLHTQQVRADLESRYRLPARDPAHTAPSLSYCPADNPLLCQIDVYPSPPSRYGASQDPVLKAAHAKARLSPSEKEPSPCSWSAAKPSYEAMNRSQEQWYLHLRERLRAGEFPPADESYLILYAIELINLTPSVLAPADALDALLRLWNAYGASSPRLSLLFPEWITDLCLLHQLSLPAQRFPDSIASMIRVASLREFFLGYLPPAGGSPLAGAVLQYGCHYSHQASPFRTDENASLFDTHIPAAFLAAFTACQEQIVAAYPAMRTTMHRHTFPGSHFADHCKNRIEVTYLSCSKSIELRLFATALVKHCENQVRRMLGIKSRYHTPNLEPAIREAVNAYFAPLLPKPAPKKDTPPPPPAWEPLYEAKTTGLSPDLAKQMEQSAWSITKQLVDAFEDEEEPAPPPPPPTAEPPAPISAPPPKAYEPGDSLLRDAFSLLLQGRGAELEPLARMHRMLPLTLLEHLNEEALSEIGDIAVEEEDGIPRLIDDYKEDIQAWLNL